MILEILKFIFKLVIGLIVMINVWTYILLQKLVKRIEGTYPKTASGMNTAFHYITLPLAPFSKMFDNMH
jgi:hypothetical protein